MDLAVFELVASSRGISLQWFRLAGMGCWEFGLVDMLDQLWGTLS